MKPEARDAAALAGAVRFIETHARSAEQAAVLQRALDGVRLRRQRSAATYYLGCVHVPLLVYGAIRGDAAPALPLAVAATLLHTGLDLFDDVMDGDLAPVWQAVRPAEVVLTAATLLCALPQLALAELPTEPATIVALQRMLARAGLALSDGQQRDVAQTGRGDVSVTAILATVAGKSGAELALYAALAARLAGAAEPQIEQYAALGGALGVARQLRSDCHDLLAPDGRDLANGTRTLPLALLLEQLPDAERNTMLALLGRAERDAAARKAVRTRIREVGVLHECALIIERYCQKAYSAVVAAGASAPAAAELFALIEECSFFDKNNAQGGEPERWGTN